MSEVGELLEEFETDDFTPFWRTPGRAVKVESSLDEHKMQDILSSGVYALCYEDTVIYVGKAKVLIQRVYQHYNAMQRVKKGLKPLKGTKGFTFTKIRIFLCSVEELASLEQKLIARFRPKYNERLVPKLLGKMTLAQCGFKVEKLGIAPAKPIPRPVFTHKRRF